MSPFLILYRYFSRLTSRVCDEPSVFNMKKQNRLSQFGLLEMTKSSKLKLTNVKDGSDWGNIFSVIGWRLSSSTTCISIILSPDVIFCQKIYGLLQICQHPKFSTTWKWRLSRIFLNKRIGGRLCNDFYSLIAVFFSIQASVISRASDKVLNK